MAWPVGTRLLAPHRLACRDHIYEVLSEALWSDKMWAEQVVKCLVCDEIAGPLMVHRWQEADAEAVAKCLASIEADVRRLLQAKDTLTGERVWVNFE